MTELRKLRDVDPTPLERVLLASADQDCPPANGRTDLLRALGLAGGLAVTAATTEVMAGSAAAPVLGAAANAASKASALLALKWCAAGLLLGGVATSTVAQGLGWTGEREQTRSEQPGPSALARLPDRRRTGVPARAAPPEALPNRAAVVDSARRRPLAHDTTPRPGAVDGPLSASIASPTSIAAELGLIDEARAANQARLPQRALELLDEREHRFGAGAFAPEARLLRCEALLGLGQRQAAAALASDYLRQPGDSPHHKRMRRLLERASMAAEPATERQPARTSPSGPSMKSFPDR